MWVAEPVGFAPIVRFPMPQVVYVVCRPHRLTTLMKYTTCSDDGTDGEATETQTDEAVDARQTTWEPDTAITIHAPGRGLFRPHLKYERRCAEVRQHRATAECA